MNLEELKSKLDQMPAQNQRGMFSEIDKAKVEAAVADIFQAGPAAWGLLIDQIVDPEVGGDCSARYALHVLGLHIAKLRQAEASKAFTAALCKPLAGDKPPMVKAYLVQEIQYYGTTDAVPVLAGLLGDAVLCDWAARAMLSIGGDCVSHFRQALPGAKGGCRRTLVQALGRLKDAPSVAEIQKAAADEDTETRMVALWALAAIGDAGSADLILKAAQAPPGWPRVQAAKACLVLAEKLLAAGNKEAAARLTTYLKETRTDKTEKYIAEAADRIK